MPKNRLPNTEEDCAVRRDGLEAVRAKELECLKTIGWYAHYVHPDPDSPTRFNAHTHGLDLKGLGLVTLSACQTGLGENGAGDDLISLENAFFFAGAESVVASLWKVDDDATARLMTEFYANLKTMSRARALQEAQKTIKQTSPGPYFWAPFILIGPSS